MAAIRSEQKVRIPDITVWSGDVPIEPVFTRPPLIAIEVISPEDRPSRAQRKIQEYKRSAVPNIWYIDPVERVSWNCSDGSWTMMDRLEVPNTPIYLDLAEVACEVDRRARRSHS